MTFPLTDRGRCPRCGRSTWRPADYAVTALVYMLCMAAGYTAARALGALILEARQCPT